MLSMKNMPASSFTQRSGARPSRWFYTTARYWQMRSPDEVVNTDTIEPVEIENTIPSLIHSMSCNNIGDRTLHIVYSKYTQCLKNTVWCSLFLISFCLTKSLCIACAQTWMHKNTGGHWGYVKMRQGHYNVRLPLHHANFSNSQLHLPWTRRGSPAYCG